MTWITDGNGTRWVEETPRKKRKPARKLRFANLQPGTVLIHRQKIVSQKGGPRDPLAANDDAPLMATQYVGFALVEDRWFDPCAGQDDPLKGEMASVRALTQNGPSSTKWPHTLRGLANQGYHYTTPEQAARIMEAIQQREDMRKAWLAGELSREEAVLRAPSWASLIRELNLEPPPPEKVKPKKPWGI